MNLDAMTDHNVEIQGHFNLMATRNAELQEAVDRVTSRNSEIQKILEEEAKCSICLQVVIDVSPCYLLISVYTPSLFIICSF